MTTARFSGTDESVGAARSFVAGTIVDASPDVRDSVALMVSELATNALVHAAGGFEVSVERTEGVVRVSVSDGGEGTPVLQAPPSSEPHGRGLRIVDELSDAWGVSPAADGGGHGKSVWFRMSLLPTGADGLVTAGSEVPGVEAGTTR